MTWAMGIRRTRVVLWGCTAAVIAGAFAGATARVLMRLFAVVGDGDPFLTVAGTTGIIVLFILSVVPGGIASAATKGRRLTVTLYVVGSLPVAWNGLMIGWQEWTAASDRGFDPSEVALLVVLTFGIGAVTLINPFLTHRLAGGLPRYSGRHRTATPRKGAQAPPR